jgi:hypothetical protein
MLHLMGIAFIFVCLGVGTLGFVGAIDIARKWFR